ncbi:peptidase S41, partial [Patescibacteria group bacterium]|nr:peptidase S41 [Patescibacteria group bacterium]
GGIHITVAKWLTPNGRWVNETQGLEPDVKVEVNKQSSSGQDSEPKEDVTKDPQLDKAIELLD